MKVLMHRDDGPFEPTSALPDSPVYDPAIIIARISRLQRKLPKSSAVSHVSWL